MLGSPIEFSYGCNIVFEMELRDERRALLNFARYVHEDRIDAVDSRE